MNKKINSSNDRLSLATQIASGLLASQNPEKGWNLDTLTVLSLRIADKLIEFNSMKELPELLSSQPKPSEKQA
jgi:hypothetical protein